MDEGPPTGGEGPAWVLVVTVVAYVWVVWAVVSGPLQVWAGEKEWRAPALLYGLPFVLFALFVLMH